MVKAVKDFAKQSFQNGNRYTNISVTIIMLLLAILGFFARELYGDLRKTVDKCNNFETRITVIESDVKDVKEDIYELKHKHND